MEATGVFLEERSSWELAICEQKWCEGQGRISEVLPGPHAPLGGYLRLCEWVNPGGNADMLKWFWVARPHSRCHPLSSLKSYWWLLRLENTVKVEKVVSSRPSLGFSGIGIEALENKASVTGLRPKVVQTLDTLLHSDWCSATCWYNPLNRCTGGTTLPSLYCVF